MDLSISLVSYNTRDLLRRCLTSIYKYTKNISFEVIVVDNNSSDFSVEMIEKEFSKVKIIQNKTNRMFTRANNQAMKVAQGKYFLILNSDTYFKDNSIKKMIEYLEKNKDVGAVEGLEIYENGKLIPNGSQFSTPLIDFYELSIIGKKISRTFFKNLNMKLLNKYRYTSIDRKSTFEIDLGCDAFLMVRKNIMDTLKGYDENLLLYYTENDLCYGIKKLGYSIIHLGDSYVVHTVSASANKLGWRKLDIYYKDMKYYYHKHNYVLSGTVLFLLLKIEEQILKIIRPNMFI